MSVGAPLLDATARLPGLAPFALTSGYWSAAGANAAIWLDDGQAQATVSPTGNISAPNLPGAPLVGLVGTAPLKLTSLGQRIAPAGSSTPLSSIAATDATLYAYSPIHEQIGAQPQTIIGFGYVQWTYNATSGALTIRRPFDATQAGGQQLIDRVAAANASATLAAALPTTFAPADLDQLFQRHHQFEHSLLTPVLVNH